MQPMGGDDKRNLLVLLALSFMVLLGGDALIRWWRGDVPVPAQEHSTAAVTTNSKADVNLPSAPDAAPKVLALEDTLQAAQRLHFETPTLQGSFNLHGGQLDDVVLKGYRDTLAQDSSWVRLLHPAGTSRAYYVQWHWLPAEDTQEAQTATASVLPTADAVWKGYSDNIPAHKGWKGVLWWQHPSGVRFEKHITIDTKGMLFMDARVKNTSSRPLRLKLVPQLRRIKPQDDSSMNVHNGVVGVLDGSLKELTYDKLQSKGAQHLESNNGWIGLTDKFWLAAFAPKTAFNARLVVHATEKTQAPVAVDIILPAFDVPAGSEKKITSRLYVGAKTLDALDGYEASEDIKNFDLAVDFGWFYFITKPTFYVLSWLKGWCGNFGLAILLFTVLLKMLFFPLAQRSNHSMGKMKELAPEIERLKNRFKDDKQRMGQEVMALYRKHKVNPVSGCLPMLLQLPFFFALYKVLMVSIEMRHAPFWGWITDLSAPDPTNLFNLFGLLPFTPPSFFHIGLWPLLMGVSMFFQQKMNPPAADPSQQKIFLYGMPVMFTFMFGNLAAGVVIFWTWNNILSMAQQWYTTRKR